MSKSEVLDENQKNENAEQHKNDVSGDPLDLFKIKTEIKYHNIKKFRSAGVMEAEKEVMTEIISYKKSKNAEFEYYESKSSMLDMEISKLQTAIICNYLTLEGYKQQIQKQLNLEEKLLDNAKGDTELNNEEKEKVINRIQNRIEIIKSELSQEINEEDEEGENLEAENKSNLQTIEEQQKAEEIKNENENEKSTKEEITETLKTIVEEVKDEDQSNEKKEYINNSESYKSEINTESHQSLLADGQEKQQEIDKQNKNTDENHNKDTKQIIKTNEAKIQENLSTNYESNKSEIIIIPEENASYFSNNNNISDPFSTHNATINKSFRRQDSLISNATIVNLVNQNIDHIPEKKLSKEEIQKRLIENVMYQTLKVRFKEYVAAIKYFRENYCTKEENDAITKARLVQKNILDMEDGKEIDESKVPLGVSPEYICSCSKKERIDKYSVLIKELNKNKVEFQNQRNKILADFKAMEKKDQLKKQDEIKREIIDLDSKIKAADIQVKKFMLDLKKLWVPCPQYVFIEEEEKKEKIVFDIPENTLQINLESCNYDKRDAYVYVSLDLGEGRSLGEWVYIKNFPKIVHMQIEKNDLYTLHKKFVEINLYRSHWYWPFQYSLKGTIKIKLESLKSLCEIQNNKYIMNLLSKRREVEFEAQVGLRTPLHQKEYISIYNPKISITKIYGEFKLPVIQDEIQNSQEKPKTSINNDSNINEPKESIARKQEEPRASIKTNPDKEIILVNGNDNKSSLPKIPENKNNEKNDEPKEEPQPSAEENITVNVAEFTKEELDDPDILENLVSMKVMELKIQKLDAQIKQIEGRTPAELRRKYLNLKVRYNSFKENIVDGKLSIKDYILVLEKQILKDKKLLAYFKQIKDSKKVSLIYERLNLMVKELKEASEHMK